MSGQSLLVVDDDRTHSTAVAAILSPLGYTIDIAKDGPTAIKLVERNTYALAILDYQMPGMHGVELFRQIHELRPEMKGVLLTAYTTLDKVFPAIDSGIERVLAKPVNARELVPLVEQLVGTPSEA